MDLMPILEAALQATGSDPKAETVTIESVAKAQQALRLLDIKLSEQFQGHTLLGTITVGGDT